MVFPWVYVLLAALMLGGSTDRPGGFTVVGPGGGGAMFHPTVSPHDTETILVSCDMHSLETDWFTPVCARVTNLLRVIAMRWQLLTLGLWMLAM